MKRDPEEVAQGWRADCYAALGIDMEGFDAARLRAPRQHERIVEAFHRGHSGRGLFLHGFTGSGKTWTACRAVEAMVYSYPGTAAVVHDAGELKDRLSELARDPAGRLAFMDDLTTCDVLLVDDLFHVANEGYVEALRRIIQKASTVVLTSQFSLVEVVERYAREPYARGIEAIARRIEDGCDIHELTEEINF